jgi:hypothetical protein
MKRINLLIIIFLSLISFSSKSQHKKISVLFIGNSYTAVNNLPALVDSLAIANGDTILTDQNTPGGYTLQMHSTDATTLSKIHQRAWDYVVLQEQSQLPSFDSASVIASTIPYALILDSIIRANNSCTQIIFYMTWGRKYGDASNCPFYPPVCTYSGMQQRLKESYLWMADTCHRIVAPVGEAFRRSIQIDSTLELYQSDQSHPSMAGSYLAACVFYEVLIHKSFGTNPYFAGLPSSTAYFLNGCARSAVNDSLNLWNIGIYEPRADFKWHENNGLVQFTGVSDSTFSHYWDFGDTTFSTLPNPLHQYHHSRYWPVYHLVYDSCVTDSFELVTNIIGPALVPEISKDEWMIFPNPASDIIHIVLPLSMMNEHFHLVIEDISGRILREEKNEIQESIISVSDLSEGIYFIRITDAASKTIFSRKIVMMK